MPVDVCGLDVTFQSAPGIDAGGIFEFRRVLLHRKRFQSAPGIDAGGNRPWNETEGCSVFQSAPGIDAGGNRETGSRTQSVSECFNPPPALMPGETAAIAACGFASGVFQSAPGIDAGGITRTSRSESRICLFQSAPGIDAGGIVSRGRAGERRQVSIRPRH